MDGESDMSFHLLSSSLLSDREMEKGLVHRKKALKALLHEDLENIGILEIM